MREWALSSEDPLALRLAADVRMGPVDYADDQIWELKLEGGEPAALALETSYGLRARSMRIFPSFVWDGDNVIDPAQFASPPIVRRFLPNYVQVDYAPFKDLEVRGEYWVSNSHTVVGRCRMLNMASRAKQLRFRLHAILRPGENPQAMSETSLEGVAVLAGRTGSVAPVIFMAGGAVAEEANFPGLAIEYVLAPGAAKSIRWAHAGLKEPRESFEAARDGAGRSWDAEIARLEMKNSSMVEIETGDPDWDIALALAQKVSLACFVGPTRYLPHPSLVETRLPRGGYSARGDGKDYDLHWNGQSADDAYFSLMQILPVAPELAKGVIRNFIAVQSPDGVIDGKPGLGGQRNGANCIPLLATLAWRTFQYTRDHEFLKEILPPLLDFNQSWFTKSHDRDQDGHPEWDHTLQAGFAEWPSFVRWRAWGQGLEISKAETPDLASYLYRECRSLLCMARELDRVDLIPDLDEKARRLRESVGRGWNEELGYYCHMDRDLHVSPSGQLLGRKPGNSVFGVQSKFDPPGRVLVKIYGPEREAHGFKVLIRGRGRRGRHRVESLEENRFQWFWDCGSATSDKVYAEIEQVEIQGLEEQFESEIRIAGYSRLDLTNLLPLWAGIPGPAEADRLISETILNPNRFWRPHGIPRFSAQDPAYEQARKEGCAGVEMLWNTMIGEGLVDYGFLDQAAALVGRLMHSVVEVMRKDNGFREAYSADELRGFGERDHLAGVAPLYLFLYTLGIRLISPRRVWLRGHNPFPWSVLVRWRGLEIVRDGLQTWVTFPDGQRIAVEGEKAQIVEQEV